VSEYEIKMKNQVNIAFAVVERIVSIIYGVSSRETVSRKLFTVCALCVYAMYE
jgi:hypothetical protein